MPGPSYTITFEGFDSLASYWRNPHSRLQWDCLFVLPPWLEVWWQKFGSGPDLYLCVVRKRDAILGVAPLQLKEQEATFIGSDDVCDCLDFVVGSGSEHDFFNVLLDDLGKRGIRRMILGPLRPDSNTMRYLVGIAKDRRYEVSCEVEDISLELDLPSTWEEYLGILSGKQRHEVRRKLRRLHEAGEVNYRIAGDNQTVADTIDLFLKFFQESRNDKEIFLTTKRESFFRSLARAMAQDRLLQIGILELDAKPVAAIMCFNYNDTVYLYNNGYDPHYRSLSIGLLSKILCIKDSIKRGRKKFDFLKGAEEYKYRLGGQEVHLQRCQIVLS